jgi:hypothetical protein
MEYLLKNRVWHYDALKVIEDQKQYEQTVCRLMGTSTYEQALIKMIKLGYECNYS